MDSIYEKAVPLAGKIMNYARDSILVNMRFLDVALSAITPKPENGLGGFASDGVNLYYDPVFLLKKYKEEPVFAVRMYLHVLFHLIFSHSFRFDKVDREAWSLSADIAAEAAVMELQMPGTALGKDEEAGRKLRAIKEDIGALSAEKVYRYLKNFPVRDRKSVV